MTGKKVTLKDVAQAAGTSPSTVSLALRNDPRISLPVRTLVKETADRLGYRVNLLGAMLRTEQPRVLGVVADLAQELHISYVQQMTKYADEQGYHLITESISNYFTPQAAFAALKQFDLKTSIAINPPREILAAGDFVPQVVIGQSNRGEAADEQELAEGQLGSDLVTSDNRQGMIELVSHLQELGHRELIYLDGPKGASARARLEALEQACRAAKIKMQRYPAGDNLSAGYEAVMQLLADRRKQQEQGGLICGAGDNGILALAGQTGLTERVTAVVCYNDHCAQGALIALWKAGVRVPQELSVTGYDNSKLAASEAFNLTSVDRGVERLAQWAINRAIGWNEGQKLTPEQIKVDTTLIKRSSTGVPAYPSE